jgi:NAD+ kinase
MARKRILILGNMAKPGVRETIDGLGDWFAERGEVVGVYPSDRPALPPSSSADLCVVFGGDGTLLSAARLLAESGVPLLGVNMGKLGFLADFNVEHMQKHLEAVLRGQVQPTERMMVEVCADRAGQCRFRSPASNDVAISAGAPFRMIDLLVARDAEQIARYLGDGVILATPTGSTGYNMSAGGPILEPTLEAVAITPIAPHSLSMRPIVVGADVAIRVTATRVNAGTSLIVDGQVSCELADGDAVEVRRAATPMRIISHPGRRFFDTLTRKLHWGHSPHHAS